jgi:hypothetical protein
MAHSKRKHSRAKHGNRKSGRHPEHHIVFQTKYMNQDTRYLSNLLGEEAVPSICRPIDDDDDDDEFEIDINDVSLLPRGPPCLSTNWDSDSSHGSEDSDDDDSKDVSEDDSEDDIEYDNMNKTTKLKSRTVLSSDVMKDVQDLEDMLFLQRYTSNTRKKRWDHGRLNWDNHVAQLKHENSFVNEYTMSVPAHGKLVRILDPILERAEYNSRCSEPILVQHIVAAGLRALAGGRVKDQRHIIGSSRSAAYEAVDDFIDAVNGAHELDIHLPQTLAEWQRIRDGFTRKSTDGIIHGCVGALDGFFQRTNRPTKKEASNQLAYYSGHYESYGVNCQACVQSDLQFTYFGVISPGSTNDNISYPSAKGLKEVFSALPPGLYGLADAAYTLSENMLIPFTGVARLDPAQDAFNYYLSQLRIRVEMAFGRLVNKFRILNGKVEGSLDRVTAVLTACARLHNFIIQEDGPFEKTKANVFSLEDEIESLEIRPDPSAPLGMSYLPVVPNEEFEMYEGISQTRGSIVDFIRDHGIGRPLHNIERKKLELSAVMSTGGLQWDREFVSPI